MAIDGWKNGVLVDPVAAGATAGFAFIPTSAPSVEPGTSDWQAGTFEKSGEQWWALCLVGPGGGVPLAPDDYVVWAEVTNAPDQPRRPVGLLRVV